jgi:hypothetical protein
VWPCMLMMELYGREGSGVVHLDDRRHIKGDETGSGCDLVC